MFEQFDKLKKPGATLAAVAALGAVSIKAADAMPASANTNIPAAAYHTETAPSPKLPQDVPEGVHAINSESAIKMEAGQALRKMKKHWNGVLVLHAPTKKNAYVGYAKSPSAYYSDDPHLYVLGKKNLSGVIAVNPGIVNFKNRTFAVVYDQDPQIKAFRFLDVTWAEEVGALSTYAFRGTPARAVPDAFDRVPMVYDTPEVVPSPAEMTSIWLPSILDPHRKKQQLTPTSVIPHG